jgi:hypothetical protein
VDGSDGLLFSSIGLEKLLRVFADRLVIQRVDEEDRHVQPRGVVLEGVDAPHFEPHFFHDGLGDYFGGPCEDERGQAGGLLELVLDAAPKAAVGTVEDDGLDVEGLAEVEESSYCAHGLTPESQAADSELADEVIDHFPNILLLVVAHGEVVPLGVAAAAEVKAAEGDAVLQQLPQVLHAQ